MNKLIIFICIGLLSCCCNFGEVNIAGHEPKHKSLQIQQEYILHLYGEGKFNVILTDNNTTKTFNVDLALSNLGFQVVVGGNAFDINFPCQVVINNLNKSTAVYILGDLNLLMGPKVIITTGVYGQFRPFIESVMIDIDVNGNIN